MASSLPSDPKPSSPTNKSDVLDDETPSSADNNASTTAPETSLSLAADDNSSPSREISRIFGAFSHSLLARNYSTNSDDDSSPPSNDVFELATDGFTPRRGNVMSDNRLARHQLSMEQVAGLEKIPAWLIIFALDVRDGSTRVVTSRSAPEFISIKDAYAEAADMTESTREGLSSGIKLRDYVRLCLRLYHGGQHQHQHHQDDNNTVVVLQEAVAAKLAEVLATSNRDHRAALDSARDEVLAEVARAAAAAAAGAGAGASGRGGARATDLKRAAFGMFAAVVGVLVGAVVFGTGVDTSVDGVLRFFGVAMLLGAALEVGYHVI